MSQRVHNSFCCTYCYRSRTKRVMKRDVDCLDALCIVQHWMCRSDKDCSKAMKHNGVLAP